MTRLYLQFYATILVVLAVFVAAALLLWRVADDDNRTPQYLDVAAALTAALMPDESAPQADQQRAVTDLNRKLKFDIALYKPNGDMIAMAGKPPPPFNPNRARTGWRRGPGGPTFSLQLPDGRWLVARHLRERPNPILWIAAGLGLVAIAVAVGAFPVVRRLGRRLERLKAGVEQLGGGDLSARVKVEGRDEVAALATSFNRSAQRIEELVSAHRLLLANASHELRTPLARIAVAASLLGENADAKTRESLKQDVAELDQLIEQILLASRLEALPILERREPVDLLALAAEEASHYDVEADGEPVILQGDRVLLRRLVRNLVENARRYGGDGPIDVIVKREHDCAVLEVVDRGPGVPEAERQRIFEPFYRLAGGKESGRGSGLGLALVLDIARRHGGDAVCLAAEGGGSRFRVDLPAA
ncbi:MAG: HAMP domain-containing histidine kinase [Reyranella sp.]|jgi:signal transduction histidine kinase|nr:MAG: HAMP domain-containing histidine kinase [Reyranella sp.]